MPKHGFARKKEFALESQSASQLTLLLRDDENTRAILPLFFRTAPDVRAGRERATVRHSVVNTGAGNMPFCLGAHPGFFCAEGDALALDAPETLALYRLDAEKMLLKPEPLPYPVPNGRISLSHALFQEDAMMFDGIRSRSITLCARMAAACAWNMALPPAWACGASQNRRCAMCAWSPGMGWTILWISREIFLKSPMPGAGGGTVLRVPHAHCHRNVAFERFPKIL